MQVNKGLWVAVLASVTLAACASSMIEVRKGSERVSLANADQIAACQSKGTTTVSALAKVGFIVRDAADVEANLYQLAVNDAIEVGADTIVKGDSAALGSRTYALYKCRP